MSDDTENEEIEIDIDHPWVQASTIARPMPIPGNVAIDAIKLTQTTPEGAKTYKAALLTIVDATGVKNVFMEPPMLHALLMQGSEIIQQWVEEEKQGFVIADKNMMQETIQNSKSANHLRSVD